MFGADLASAHRKKPPRRPTGEGSTRHQRYAPFPIGFVIFRFWIATSERQAGGFLRFSLDCSVFPTIALPTFGPPKYRTGTRLNEAKSEFGDLPATTGFFSRFQTDRFWRQVRKRGRRFFSSTLDQSLRDGASWKRELCAFRRSFSGREHALSSRL